MSGAVVELSVLIPTYQRPNKLRACLGALAAQDLDPGQYEVLVGTDGTDGAGAAAARERWRSPAHLHVEECPKEGLAAVRNRLLLSARGRILVSINDDVVPERGFLRAHQSAHAARPARPAIVVGDSPWVVHEPDTLFDRLIRETSMIFFYDRMNTAEGLAQPDRDWGFRHCFGLNFSAPVDLVREAGAFTVFPATYGYEDVELAFRLHERFGLPVLYRPAARADHDHFMTPQDYLERERKLGFAAWGFAHTAPRCAQALFGRDITREVGYSREFVRTQARDAERIAATFAGLAMIPARAVCGPHAGVIVNAIYEQHLLLKRWTWRRGFVQAADRAPVTAAA